MIVGISEIPDEVKEDILGRLKDLVNYTDQRYGLFLHFVNIKYDGAYFPPQFTISADVTDETGLRHEIIAGVFEVGTTYED